MKTPKRLHLLSILLPLLAAGCTEPVTEEVGGTLTLEVVSSKTVTGKTIELTAGTITTLNYTFTPLAPEETYIGSFNLVNEDMGGYLAAADLWYKDSN